MLPSHLQYTVNIRNGHLATEGRKM
jgi:hypothetical protein